MKTILTFTIGIFFMINSFASTNNQTFNNSSKETKNVLEKLYVKMVDKICELEADIILIEDMIAVNESFIKKDGFNPVYLAKIQELEEKLDKIHYKITVLSDYSTKISILITDFEDRKENLNTEKYSLKADKLLNT